VNVKADSGLVVNPDYTGKGDLINLFVDSLSTLKKGESKKTTLLARLDMTNADTLRYENIGYVSAKVGLSSTDDPSTDGDNPDPDGSGDPTNNSVPTPIVFDFDLGPKTPIGVSKSVDTTRNTDGSYLVTYTIITKNYGKDTLDSLQLTDDLKEVFKNETEFKLQGKPTLNSKATIVLDTTFNGDTKKNLLVADTSKLAPGKSDTITLKIIVKNKSKDAQTYANIVEAQAWVKDTLFTDQSNKGNDPDFNKDGNPGNDNDSTLVTLDPIIQDTSELDIFISNGISPDGNDKNDEFVIKERFNKVTLTAEDEITLHVYNRWNHLVFKSDNYIRDVEAQKPWKGNTNVGVRLEESPYLPDGTYYFVITSSNKRLFNNLAKIGFVTIKR
jgi:large repetitive protein